jgi:zinc transport system ATP-binding protein
MDAPKLAEVARVPPPAREREEVTVAADRACCAPAAPVAESLISGHALSLARNGRAVLQDVDIDIGVGEIVTLIGPNGAGKTTLVRVLLGLEATDRGAVMRQPGLVVGYVPQRLDIDRAIPLTARRFVALGRTAKIEAAEAALSEIGAAGLAERAVADLSGGELQRIMLARALSRSPRLLVLDEPTRGLDYAGEAELYGLISRLRSARKLGILLVSHDLHVVMAQSDRVVCLNRHVCCSGVPQSVAQHPEYARLFGPHAARALGLYQHRHDHRHDLAGDPHPGPAPRDPPGSGW